MRTKTKRIQVTLEVSIPDGWTIGQTSDWIEHRLSGSDGISLKWKSRCEVGEQRMTEKALARLHKSRARSWARSRASGAAKEPTYLVGAAKEPRYRRKSDPEVGYSG